MLRQQQETLTFDTPGQGFMDITDRVQRWIGQTGLSLGTVTLFLQHTSASLTIQENADPDVLHDLASFKGRISPEDPKLYRHSLEGVDDMPAHIRTVLTGVSLTIPFSGGRLALGTWQGLYLMEHRHAAHRRRLVIHAMGE